MINPQRNHVVFIPDIIPTKTQSGILINKENLSHRTGVVQIKGPEVKWHGIKEGKHYLYNQRNCVEVDGVQIILEENVLMPIDKDVVLSHEERTADNKTKVVLVKREGVKL